MRDSYNLDYLLAKELKDVKKLFNLRAIRAGIQCEVEEKAGSSRHLTENGMMLDPQSRYRTLIRLVKIQMYCGLQLLCLRGRKLELNSPQLIIYFKRICHMLRFD